MQKYVIINIRIHIYNKNFVHKIGQYEVQFSFFIMFFIGFRDWVGKKTLGSLSLSGLFIFPFVLVIL